MPTRWWSAAVAGVRRRAGRYGLLAGVFLGVGCTLLVELAVLPAFPHDQGLEKGRLVILSGADDGFGDQRQSLIDQWNALGGLPHAEIHSVAGGTTAERAEMVQRAQAGGGNVDVYNLDVTLMAEFVDFDYLRPLDAARVDQDGFLPGPLNTCRRGGKLWALPFNTDAGLLYYRTDLVPNGRAPGSWAGIRGTTEAVLVGPTANRTGLRAGYAGQLADYEGLTVNALEAIWAAGGDVVDERGRVVVDRPEAREGLRRLADGLASRNPAVVLGDSLEFDEAATTQAFRDGEVLFMRNWPVAYRALAAGGDSGTPYPAPGRAPTAGSAGSPANGSAGSPADGVRFAVASLPGPSVLGGQNLAVSAHSDQPRAAQKLIEFLTSPRSQQLLFERGGFAATQAVVYRDPEIRARYPYADTLLASIGRAQRRPDTPYYASFSKVFRQGVRYALANGGALPAGFSARLTDALHGMTRDDPPR